MFYGNPDTTQAAIVRALRDAGRSVIILSGVGRGVPDLLCGWAGGMVLLEVKSSKKVHHRPGRGLRKSQVKFFQDWRGPKPIVVETPQEAVSATVRRQLGV